VSVPLPAVLDNEIHKAFALACHPQVPVARVIVTVSPPPVAGTSCVAGDSVYAQDAAPCFSRKSARVFAGTATPCSPASYPAADARTLNASAARSSIRYSPLPLVTANLPALTPPTTSTRAPAIPRRVLPSLMTPPSAYVAAGGGNDSRSDGTSADRVAFPVNCVPSVNLTLASTALA